MRESFYATGLSPSVGTGQAQASWPGHSPLFSIPRSTGPSTISSPSAPFALPLLPSVSKSHASCSCGLIRCAIAQFRGPCSDPYPVRAKARCGETVRRRCLMTTRERVRQ